MTLTEVLSVTRLLDQELASVGRARKQVRLALGEWGLDGHVELAELIVSELVTNALCHGAGPVTMRVSVARDRIRTEVHDHGIARPTRRHAASDDESGRGLELLEALTVIHGGELGVIDDRNGPGKTVYVEISISTSPAEARVTSMGRLPSAALPDT